MRHICVIAYQLHHSKGSEYAVAWDYVTHMNKNNRLTVFYGTCNGHHNIGNISEMEEFIRKNDVPNVKFVGVKPSFVSHNYDFSIIGQYKFYKEYRKWHEDVRVEIEKLDRKDKIDVIHYLGPIGYREPGCVYNLPIPYIWGPIGGVTGAELRLLDFSFTFKESMHLAIKTMMNWIQLRTDYRVKKAINNADVVLCATNEYKAVVEKVAKNKHHSQIIYKPENCIASLFPLNYNKFKTKTIRLIFVGWLDSRKALNIILDALSKLTDEQKIQVFLDVIGDGPLKDKLIMKACHLGLSNAIKWHGRIDRKQVFDIMNEAHLMVLPSLSDANTTVVWEAYSVGLPILALDHCGFHDTVNNCNGYLIPIHSYKQVVKDISACLKKIINNPIELKEKAEYVLKDREQYVWEKRIEFFEDIYEIATYQNQLRK